MGVGDFLRTIAGVGRVDGHRIDPKLSGKITDYTVLGRPEQDHLHDGYLFAKLSYDLGMIDKGFTPPPRIDTPTGKTYFYDLDSSKVSAKSQGDLDAVCYRTADRKQMRIAFAGTQGITSLTNSTSSADLIEGALRLGRDGLSDASQYFGNTPDQYKEAAEYLKKMLEQAKKDGVQAIDISGHSLGGGLMQYAMLKNAELISEMTKGGMKITGSTLNPAALSADIRDEFLKNPNNSVKNVMGLMTHSFTDKDALNDFGQMMNIIRGDNGAKILGGKVVFVNTGSGHSVDDLLLLVGSLKNPFGNEIEAIYAEKNPFPSINKNHTQTSATEPEISKSSPRPS